MFCSRMTLSFSEKRLLPALRLSSRQWRDMKG
ncbi:hypothetical protein LINPERHAP2_LOCUS9208 [Linum perenne]